MFIGAILAEDQTFYFIISQQEKCLFGQKLQYNVATTVWSPRQVVLTDQICQFQLVCRSPQYNRKIKDIGFISPPNVYMSNTGLVPGSTGGYTARWCQRAV